MDIKSKPNIIFIMADQLAASLIGCYGSKVNSTPNLDQLAEQGTKFMRNYSTSPVCAPNRASILTGRSPEIHGIVSNNYALQTDNPTYAHILKQNGYRTGGFGKFHQTPMMWPVPANLKYLGFDQSVISEDTKWGPWIDWVRANHPEQLDIAIAMTNGQSGLRGSFPEIEMEQGASYEEIIIKNDSFERLIVPLIRSSEWDRMYASPLPAEVHDTKFITDMGLEFIKLSEHNKQTPFFCHISYVDPHDPYDPPAPYDIMFDPQDMLDPLPAEWMEQGPYVLDKQRDDYLNFRSICDNKDAVKKLRALYHGSLKFIDDQIGRIIEYLKQSELWENTIILFTSDHGEMLGDHGLVSKGPKHYDKGIRCPLIVSGGPVNKGITERLTCSLDFFATFCEWAGAELHDLPPYEGKSFASVCGGGDEKDNWDEISVAIGDCDSVITNDGFRLTRFSSSNEGQMFDLNNDPEEQHNLYDNINYSSKKVELLERLIKARVAPRVIPQYRNLPVKDGRKYLPEARFSLSIPFIEIPDSPWLNDTAKPHWRA
jgi:arylsulfatase